MQWCRCNGKIFLRTCNTLFLDLEMSLITEDLLRPIGRNQRQMVGNQFTYSEAQVSGVCSVIKDMMKKSFFAEGVV